jgi:anti-anti-sigma factor
MSISPFGSLESQSRNPLQILTERLDTTDVRITVAGSVDMCTAHQLSHYVIDRTADCKLLTLDMTRVTFLDCAGISALYRIDDRCRGADVTWIIEPAQCVSRVIGICDPLRELPVSAGGGIEPACA